jgi:long-chain acyl-CoA synthetase
VERGRRCGRQKWLVENTGMVPQTLIELFLQAVATYNKRDALMVKREGSYQPISSQELLQSVQQLAAALVTLGIESGDRVALLSENRPEWTISDMAILSAGAVNVPLYPTLPASQIQTLLKDAGVKAVVVSNAVQQEKILQIKNRVPSLEKILLIETTEPQACNCLSFESLLKRGTEVLGKDPSLFSQLCQRVKPEYLASILYTSGTMGLPKGVMLSHSNMVSNVLSCSEVFQLDTSDVALSFLPLCHIFERTACYLQIYRGVTIAYAESPETVPQNLLEVRPTLVTSVPRLFEKMQARIIEMVEASPLPKRSLIRWGFAVGKEYSRCTVLKARLSPWLKLRQRLASILVFSKLRKKLGGRLRMFISGGAPLDRDLAEFFLGVGVLILEGYGLTETSPVISVNTDKDLKLGTVGKPLPGVQVKIAEDGEILTRSASVMVGYLNQEQETREALEGGWFHTGDIGELDEEGFLKITGRKKDMLVTAGGKNVAPQKIEGLLNKNPYFRHVVVVGDKRPFIAALVVPSPDKVIAYASERGLDCGSYSKLVQSAEVRDLLMEQIRQSTADLAPFEQIKRIAVLENEFSVDNGELTPKMNVRRHRVETTYKDLIDSIYSHVTTNEHRLTRM